MTSELIIAHFQNEGYIVVDNDNYSELGIAPNLVLEANDVIKAFVIRESSDSLPEAMIQRFSDSKRIPLKTLEIYFTFPSKPNLKILSACKLFRVGILYLDGRNAIQVYAESKTIKGRKKVVAIPKTQMFFSSKQILEERQEGENIITEQRESLKVPIFAMLVENDQQYSSDIRKLWPIICRCMDDCDYILVVLSGEYRRIIDRETRRALEYYDPEEIVFYVKNDKETKEAWRDLLLFATDNGVKYTEYFDTRDFRIKFNARLMRIIKTLHKKHGVDFLEDSV